MGYDPFTRDAPDRVVATLTRSPRGLVATVDRFDSKGVRQWDTKTYDPLNVPCKELVRAMGIYIATRFLPLFEPPAGASAAPAPPSAAPASSAPLASAAPASSSAPASSAAPVAREATTRPADEAFGDRDRNRMEIGFMALTSVGLLPSAGFGGGASVGIRWRWAGIGLEARFLRTLNFALDPDHSAYSVAGLGLLHTCAHGHAGAFLRTHSIDTCALLGLGWMAHYPTDDVGYEIAHPFMMLLGLRFGLTWQPLPGLYMKGFAEFTGNPVREHLSVNGMTVWGDTVPAQLGGFLGVAFNLVAAQPARWNGPPVNPDEENRAK